MPVNVLLGLVEDLSQVGILVGMCLTAVTFRFEIGIPTIMLCLILMQAVQNIQETRKGKATARILGLRNGSEGESMKDE